jgi:hypothetical protein
MEVFFQMRFSYCGKPDGLVSRRDKTSNRLCETEILRQFELLERLTLPSLRDQDDPSFRLVLLTSARMPEDCKDHLTWLLNHYLPGRSDILYARPMVPGRVFRKYMQSLGHRSEPVVQTQVLDGDAFGRRFVQTLREHAIENWASEPVSGSEATSRGTFMSFKRGFNLRMVRKKPVGLEAICTPSTPFGLSLVARSTGRYNPALVDRDALGVKLPHSSIRTRDIHCLRLVTGEAAEHMPPIEEGLLSEAQREFSVLRSAREISTAKDRPENEPVHVDGVVKLRRTG